MWVEHFQMEIATDNNSLLEKKIVLLFILIVCW